MEIGVGNGDVSWKRTYMVFCEFTKTFQRKLAFFILCALCVATEKSAK